MGIPEETGKVATSAIDAMKGSPSCLAAILLAAIMAILTYFALQARDQRSHEEFLAVVNACGYLQQVEQTADRRQQ